MSEVMQFVFRCFLHKRHSYVDDNIWLSPLVGQYDMSPEVVLPLREGLLQIYYVEHRGHWPPELAPKKSWYILVV